uniref:Uncharacterized protein n=1 Tax=Anguilla anguilla TaxID=7936 RepID=A0A0E9RHI4_ANGAN
MGKSRAPQLSAFRDQKERVDDRVVPRKKQNCAGDLAVSQPESRRGSCGPNAVSARSPLFLSCPLFYASSGLASQNAQLMPMPDAG